MANWFSAITTELKDFIQQQKVFFVATAPHQGRINLSPKGMDTFRVLDANRAIYLDITGSGNETAAHLLDDGRITIMFCSFDSKAQIARLYGRGRVIHPGDALWSDYLAKFPPEPGVRQIMEIAVESAMTSCGYAVPRMENLTERDTLRKYWEKKIDKVPDYQRENNLRSIDGLPTRIFDSTTASSDGDSQTLARK
ncbi:MAG TPA: pyridoxamine 5'-phosphate oxidase family protein [Candidatus Binataceae bacterium]|nr:pyridoxamine 5'-phosphate oxidase family protein [Candidatus Binataceae bacterium]